MGKLSYLQKSCIAKTSKLMATAEMLSPGARIGVAISGGVDSGVLLKILTIIKKKLPFDIEIMALHINPGFDVHNHDPLISWVKELGVSAYFTVTDFGVKAHSGENRSKSPCFFCAWRRRKRLFELVKKFKLTHLALGHNGDDLVSTFFMNLFYSGRVETMYPKEIFFKGEFYLIRPLLLIEKNKIIKVAKEFNIPVIENPCPSVSNTSRSSTIDMFERLCFTDKRFRKNTFSALYNYILKNPMPNYNSR
ncbi:tRNA 2-thiocytidine biosynthesis TtcA family protein [Desulfothermus okinawensis JCM 13304]